MILLAVSGGIDSMCMAEMALARGDEFAVAHCNFSLRGEESDGDEQFVRDWCDRHGRRLHCKRFDTASYAAQKGISIEMAARELRYAWFADLCESEGYERVAVAHNANDNAETLMLNLLRGTGSRGIRGMSSMAVERPLLGMTREEIRAWMTSHGCSWREDSTNSENLYKRNRIRNEVFPVFGEINPSFIRTLGEDMKRFAQVDDIAEDYFRDSGLSMEGGLEIDGLRSRRHWQYLLYRLTEGSGVNSDELQSLVTALESGRPLAGKSFGPLVLSSDRIYIRGAVNEGETSLTVEGPGTYVFKGQTFKISAVTADGLNPKCPAGTLMADAGALTFPFLLRGWMAGDWMTPLGMKGRKKLSDLFVDLKFSPVDKDRAVVAVSPALNSDGSGHVAALLCLRIDDSLKITDSSCGAIVITMNK